MARKPKAMAVQSFKGFNQDWTCRGYQFEVGKTYSMSGKIEAFARGFHACENPFDVLSYYPLTTSVFAAVEQGGALARHDEDSKIASASITIKAELQAPDYIKRAVAWLVANVKTNVSTGYRSHAASTGDSSHAASTGNCSHAASTGNCSHAASTGDCSHAASTGKYAHAASTGDCSHAASTGDRSHAASTGNHGIAMACGFASRAKAGPAGAIVLACISSEDCSILAVRASKVGENGIKPNTWYSLNQAGEFVEEAE